MGGERSLFDWRNRRSGFVGGEGRSLFGVEFRRSLIINFSTMSDLMDNETFL